ncbi:MAG: hypothetical protein QN120_02195 [Armatimonadota bacterium]|nr:hypothetical protein [Armatimonadota bacterium]
MNATDLERWADRRGSQEVLPELVRRLVIATSPRISRASFPSGEGIQLGGWDGIVEAEQGNVFVPGGISGWELGTSRDVRRKAQEDYERRTAAPSGLDPARSTFVFVTPRRWAGKDQWAGERRAEHVWRDVRAYDADDLAAWLVQAPAVYLWISTLLGKRPLDSCDLGGFWEDWAATTLPAATPALVLAGRGEAVSRIHDWLRAPSGALALQAETREEALAIFAAAVKMLPEDEQRAYLSRAVVVRSEGAWHQVAAGADPLILVRDFDSTTAVGHAVRAGHRVLIPLGRGDSAHQNTVTVPPLSRDQVETALVAAGLPAERARDLAALARRSLTAFRRKLAVSPEAQQPVWARAEHGSSLLPALLAGAWNDKKTEGDQEAIAALSGASYDEVVTVLGRWANEPDAPVRRFGDAWYLVSREDAWPLLARYLTRNDLERFQRVALEVLGTPDPRFDVPVEQRWMANVLGHAHRWSDLIREGFAGSLAIMGARGEQVAIGSGGSVRDFAMLIVRGLLARANADWRIWASLSPVLPLLAEAAPDAFLEAVDRGLAGDQPVLLNVFTDRDDGLFASSPHTGLLWALEALAWNPQYLGYVARLLATLARLDPGGRLANRPQASLRAIFLLWLPQTAATLEQRLSVLDSLRDREPEVAWTLMMQLLPRTHDVGHPTAKPQWREWRPDEPEQVTHAEFRKGVQEIAARLLEDVGESGSRWEDLIAALPSLPPATHEAAVDRLRSLDPEGIRPEDRSRIWDGLRKLVARHRSFPDADWALPEVRLEPLAAIMERWEPAEPTARYGWLFSHSPDLPEGLEANWAAHEQAVAHARLEAVRTLYNKGGLAEIMAIVGAVEVPGELGVTLGRSGLAEVEEDGLLSEHLAANDVSRAQFARGFAIGRIASRGREWATAKLKGIGQGWTPAQRAEMLVCMPTDPETWDLAATLGQEIESCYWRLVSPYGINNTHAAQAVRNFLKHDRPFAAIKLLAHREVTPASLAAEALESVLQTSTPTDRPDSSFGYEVGELLDRLASSGDVEEGWIARLEWAFLPLLRNRRTPKLLHRELARNPDFFVEVVSAVFRAAGEEPKEVSDHERDQAQRGYELLSSSRTVPGISEDGAVDRDRLKEWVRRARELLQARGRAVIGDEMIGQMLSGSPHGPDGGWPHPAVCDVVEEVASPDLERGIEIGVYNSRGTIVKDPYEGGAQERKHAERYQGHATVASDRWPRTAALLRRIADGYWREALREDERARLREDLNQ